MGGNDGRGVRGGAMTGLVIALGPPICSVRLPGPPTLVWAAATPADNARASPAKITNLIGNASTLRRTAD